MGMVMKISDMNLRGIVKSYLPVEVIKKGQKYPAEPQAKQIIEDEAEDVLKIYDAKNKEWVVLHTDVNRK